jgi:esterase/lipase
MSKENKVAVLGIGLGFVLFWLLEKQVFSKKGNNNAASKKKEASDQDLEVAVSAFDEALQNREDPATLNALNATFATEYNIQIHQRQSDGQLVVTDMAGNQIAIYQPQI